MTNLFTPPLILTLDIGTSSTRALLFDAQGQALPNYTVQLPNHMHTTADGGATFDWADLCNIIGQVIDQTLQKAGSLVEHIGGVGIDTFVSNVMGLDATGTPTTPLYTYADTRNTADVQAMQTESGSHAIAHIHNRTGCLLHSSYLPARFRWLKRTQPDVFAKTARWVSIGEYLFEQFFGPESCPCTASYSVASWSGLLNRKSLTWDADWLAYLQMEPACFSPLGDVSHPSQGLHPEWAARWPALQDVPWFPAIGDGAAANIGSGCDQPEQIALTIGTTGAMRVVLENEIAIVPDGLWVYRVDSKRALLGGATTEGGNLYQWLRDSLQLPPITELEPVLAQYGPATHGLVVLPFVAGERAPGWQGDARASLIGFTLNTTPTDIVRAGLESIAYRFALIYERIAPHLPTSEHQIIASGGGLLSSPTWLQIMADVLGRPILTLREGEATSRGVALLALEALDLIEQPSDLPPETGDMYEPNEANHIRYQAAVTEQVGYYEKLILT